MAITGISSTEEPVVVTATVRPARLSRERLSRAGLGLLGVALALGIWQLLTVTKVLDPSAVPTMTVTLSRLARSLDTGALWVAVGQTLEGMAIGFGLGSAAGILIGALLGASEFAYRSSFLVIEFFKTIPVIALLPLAVLLFGTRIEMKVLIVVFGVFFPTVIQTIYGVRSVDPVIRDTARAFGLSRRRRFLTVMIPSAAPYLATGLRLGATAALLLDVVAELVAGANGLGLRILQGEAGGAISYSYALILLTGAIGVLIVIGLTTVERRVLRWHELYRDR